MVEIQETILQVPIGARSLIPVLGYLAGSIVYLTGIIIAYYSKQQNRRIEQLEKRHQDFEDKCRERHEYKGIERRRR